MTGTAKRGRRRRQAASARARPSRSGSGSDGRKRSWRLWAIAGAAAVSVTLAASGAPLALRHVDAFRVGRVQVTGTEHLSSADAITASGITSRSSVFDDVEPWREALERHPLVLRARVSRRLPDTIVLAITESEPIALVRADAGDEHRPVDARGRVLPIELARLERELPVVNADVIMDGAGPSVDTAGVRLVRALARIRDTEPWLAAWTSEIAALPDGVRLTVDWPADAEVLLSAADTDALEAVRLTVLDLARNANAASGGVDSTRMGWLPAASTAEPPGPALAGTELERLDRVDARFRDQVVVTLHEPGHASRDEKAR